MISRAGKAWITHCLLQSDDNWSYSLADYNIHIIYTREGKAVWAIRFIKAENSYNLAQQINLTEVDNTDSDVLKDLIDKGEKVYIADWVNELRVWAKYHPESPYVEDVNSALKSL